MTPAASRVRRLPTAWSRRYDVAVDAALDLAEGDCPEAERLLADRPRRRSRAACEEWSLAVEGLALREGGA